MSPMTTASFANENTPGGARATMATNETIRTLMRRRSMRAFTDQPVSEGEVEALERAAQHAASSRYFNDWSAIRVTDPEVAGRLAQLGHQDYIAQAPLLYVFLIDERRNAHLAGTQGVDTSSDRFIFNTGYVFLQGQNDAILALHAMETAANSLDLGCVILGSVINDVDALIDLLHLPALVYPVLGLAIGHPGQEPDLKPRMDPPAQIFENRYPELDAEGRTRDERAGQALADFDQVVKCYYRDIRHMDAPRRSFSEIIADQAVNPGAAHEPMLPSIQRQGFHLDR